MEISMRLAFFFLLLVLVSQLAAPIIAIRFPQAIPASSRRYPNRPLKSAVFALGSFWRSEAAFGCLPGVARTLVGYSGGTKPNPDYRNLGNHAECVKIEYDPTLISFKQLLDIFWASHDSRQVFGQGPDVGNQYSSVVRNHPESELKIAAPSKERCSVKSNFLNIPKFFSIRQLLIIIHHVLQKFELKRHPFLLQLIGNMPEEELQKSSIAAKLNGYASELCPPKIQKQIDAKIDEILKNNWPILKEV
ncbi:Peptide methionine sulfoxide reductase A5 [Platanthera guangdongensis]|uniref:peptide-methionine (S)-S-oxide reductase n=1 Tax=Platanthera guangdongensis TaxID=2320717 RepID=A0ABR2MZ89_9ASPA